MRVHGALARARSVGASGARGGGIGEHAQRVGAASVKKTRTMMHKAAPFTASCNGLIDMDDDTDEIADPAGTVFSGISPSHLIIEVRGTVPDDVDRSGGEEEEEEEEEEDEDEEEEKEEEEDGVGGSDDLKVEDEPQPGDDTRPAKTNATATCAVLTTVVVVLVAPLLRSQREWPI